MYLEGELVVRNAIVKEDSLEKVKVSEGKGNVKVREEID